MQVLSLTAGRCRFSLKFPFPCSMSKAGRQQHLTMSFYVTFGRVSEYDGKLGKYAMEHHMHHIFQVCSHLSEGPQS